MENSAFSQFGSHVFDDRAMRARLPQEVYQSLRRIRDEGEQWDPRVADVVADAMKNWAMQLGATHYIHWFIPLTGAGAGKHDSFIDGVREGEPSGKDTPHCSARGRRGKNTVCGGRQQPP